MAAGFLCEDSPCFLIGLMNTMENLRPFLVLILKMRWRRGLDSGKGKKGRWRKSHFEFLNQPGGIPSPGGKGVYLEAPVGGKIRRGKREIWRRKITLEWGGLNPLLLVKFYK